MRFFLVFLCGLLLAFGMTGCVGGNTDIDPTELNDKLVEEFEPGDMVSLPEDKVGELYGVDMDTLDKYDVRVSMKGEEECELLVLKAKEAKGADAAEAAVQQAYEGRDAVYSRSGVYVFAAIGKDAKAMSEEFDSLTR